MKTLNEQFVQLVQNTDYKLFVELNEKWKSFGYSCQFDELEPNENYIIIEKYRQLFKELGVEKSYEYLGLDIELCKSEPVESVFYDQNNECTTYDIISFEMGLYDNDVNFENEYDVFGELYYDITQEIYFEPNTLFPTLQKQLIDYLNFFAREFRSHKLNLLV